MSVPGWLHTLRLRGDVLVTITLFAVLVVTLITVQERERPAQPYDLDSGAPQGLLALRLWLEDAGYDVTTTGRQQFRLNEDTSLLFVHPGARPFSAADARQLKAWVETGRTLVLVGSHGSDEELAAAFDLRVELTGTQRVREAQQVLPLLPEAPAVITHTVSPAPVVLASRSAALSVLEASGKPTLAIAPAGSGTVWYLSEDYGLTNEDLKNSGQSYLLPAFLRRVPAGGRIAFDTYHLTDVTEGLAFSSLQDWLYRTPSGWALLFGAALLCGALVWQGRRLGPALDPVNENRPREAAEFVVAMANLQRRSHQRAMVATYHHQRLKTALAKRYHVASDLADDELVRALQATDRPPDPDSLAAIDQVLAGLRGDPSEALLVQLVARSDQILHNLTKETYATR